jgi:hypothetical protein
MLNRYLWRFLAAGWTFNRLQLWAVLFVSLILRVKPGEKRNWEAISAWASSLF